MQLVSRFPAGAACATLLNMNKRLAGHIVAAFATFFVALAALLLAGCEGLPFSLSGGGAPSTTAPSESTSWENRIIPSE